MMNLSNVTNHRDSIIFSNSFPFYRLKSDVKMNWNHSSMKKPLNTSSNMQNCVMPFSYKIIANGIKDECYNSSNQLINDTHNLKIKYPFFSFFYLLLHSIKYKTTFFFILFSNVFYFQFLKTIKYQSINFHIYYLHSYIKVL